MDGSQTTKTPIGPTKKKFNWDEHEQIYGFVMAALLICFWSMPALLAQIHKTAENCFYKSKIRHWIFGGLCMVPAPLRDTLPEPHIVGAHHDVQHAWFNEQRWHEGVQGSVRHNDDGVKVINWSFHFTKTHQLYQWRYVNTVLSMEFGCTLVRYAYSAREFLTTNHLYVALILCDLHSSFRQMPNLLAPPASRSEGI